MTENQPKQDGDTMPLDNVFSSDELRVLRECNIESFYYRSVPLSTLFCTGTYFAISKGYLSKSGKFGYTPKLLLAGFFGYLVGKVSYQEKCAEKLMQLPDSKIADALRKRKNIYVAKESTILEPSFSTDIKEGEKPLFDDHRPDVRDRNEAQDDYNRVTESLSEYVEKADKELQSPMFDYAEIRKKNRDEYSSKMTEKYGKKLPENPQISNFSDPSEPNMEETIKNEPAINPNNPLPRRNQYGDIID